MTLQKAMAEAQKMANETDSSYIVCRSLLNGEHTAEVTLPTYCVRVSERIYKEGTNFVFITPQMTYFPS